MEETRACGYVENIGREGEKISVCTLKELREREVNMFTTVYIGNSQSQIMDGKNRRQSGDTAYEKSADLFRDDRRQKTGNGAFRGQKSGQWSAWRPSMVKK